MRTGSLAGCALLAALSIAGVARAEPYAVGSRVEPFRLADQHGVTQEVDETLELILFSRDMDGGDLLKQALADAPEGLLEARRSLYVADISGMPKLVAKLFALPAMRRRPYAMALDRDGAATARLPDVAGQASLIFLDRLVVVRVLHLGSAREVAQALGIAEAP